MNVRVEVFALITKTERDEYLDYTREYKEYESCGNYGTLIQIDTLEADTIATVVLDNGNFIQVSDLRQLKKID